MQVLMTSRRFPLWRRSCMWSGRQSITAALLVLINTYASIRSVREMSTKIQRRCGSGCESCGIKLPSRIGRGRGRPCPHVTDAGVPAATVRDHGVALMPSVFSQSPFDGFAPVNRERRYIFMGCPCKWQGSVCGRRGRRRRWRRGYELGNWLAPAHILSTT